MSVLNDRQRKIVVLVDAFFEAHGFSPSITDLRIGAGLTSTSTVERDLRKLEDYGCVTRRPAEHRTLRLAATTVVSRNGLVASISPVERCGPCGQDMPAGHRCKNQETPR
jgi:SOS-response transcriptional repressor LexA